jgi:hypothetical protein
VKIAETITAPVLGEKKFHPLAKTRDELAR